MRKLILSSVAAATLAGGMAVAFAAPAFASETGPNLDNCSTAAGAPIGVNVSPTPPNPTGTNMVQVCLGSPLPITGSVTVSGNATTQSGYVIAQGGDSNPGPLAGYIGLSTTEGLVGCTSGDFQGSGDNVILNPSAPAPPSTTLCGTGAPSLPGVPSLPGAPSLPSAPSLPVSLP
ncbi:MAG: hypothetical protein M0035_02285 [Actinomycetota bacterium]|jgi:hypothetical protein|nr:hypothetical protein [Actinomycetota bacterium]